VPYVKVSRDKRGYETYYLLEPGPGHPHQSRPRILFWFRTPPQIKIGREPFSEEIRQAIESQNPDLKFDWPRLMATQAPSLEAQRWRERRRLERAARQAARAEAEPDVDADSVEDVADIAAEEIEPRHSIEAAADAEAVKHVGDTAAPDHESGAPAVSAPRSSDGPASLSSSGRRRRRRRRGRRQGETQPGRGPEQVETAEPASPEPDPSGEPPEPPPPSDEV
jgi:hypothetical protein